MTLRPDLTVAAVVERDGQFLLVEERVGNRMVFNQPAGHVERGEQFIEAVVRETLEETAWTFRPQALIGIYLWEQTERQRSFLRVTYVGEVTDHDPDRPLDRGIERAVWLTRDQIVATIDDAEYVQSIVQARGNLAVENANHARAKSLLETKRTKVPA